MNAVPAAPWLNALLALLQAGQGALLTALHALGFTDAFAGQPAWPWATRLAGENLVIDQGAARSFAIALVLAGVAVLAGAVALWWRRARLVLLGGAGTLVAFAPWPPAHVLLTQAYPTSFHVSPTGFDVEAIARGRTVYASHCVSCHGADGRGIDPRAVGRSAWPPDLTGPLLARRADGEVYWRIRSGLRGRDGRPSMPGYAGLLNEAELWTVIDYMKALAAGQNAAAGGTWAQPVAAPDMRLLCRDGRPEQLADLRDRHQRLRIVAAGLQEGPPSDPRLTTVRLIPPGALHADARAGRESDADSDCVAASSDAWFVYALIAGVPEAAFSGTTLLADREGWLRARALPGSTGWSDADLLCRAPTAQAVAAPAPARKGDGLGALIARMDAEPVRYVKGGFVH